MVAHQGQTITFEVIFRTPGGVIQPIYQSDPTTESEANEGCTIVFDRGGLNHLTELVAGVNGACSGAIALYQSEWPEGIYQMVFTGFTGDGTKATRTETLEILQSAVYIPSEGRYKLADVVPALGKAIGNGPHIVTGEVSFGLTNNINTIFKVVGANVVPLSESVSVVSTSGVSGKSRGADYSIDYQTGTITMTTAPAAGSQVLVSYQHYTYGTDELLSALCCAASVLSDAGLFSYTVDTEPAISANPNSILDLLMRAARIAILENQAHRDSRTSLLWRDQGMSFDRTKIPANEIALLKQLRGDLRADIAQAKMNGFTQQPYHDRERKENSPTISIAFEVDI